MQNSPSQSPSNSKPTLAIIDGFSFLFRAFYGVRHLSTSAGLPTNALYGFAQMLIKVTKDIQPHCCVVALEGKGEGFRKTLYPEYKANRQDTPEMLSPQIPLLEPMIQAFDIPAVHQATFEADDIIATLTKQYKSTHNVVIISSDKDLMQLIEGDVYMLDTMKNKEMRAPEVFEKFGVTPDKVIDVQSLIGDSSDNIPGVPSIGPKTAAELIQAYGSLDGVYENLDNIKQQKRREKLADNKELAMLSRQLVTLNQDLPLELTSDALRFHPTLDRAAEFLTSVLEFETLAKRLVNGNHFIPHHGEEAAPAAPQVAEIEYNTHPFSRFSTNVEASKKYQAKAIGAPASAPAPEAVKATYETINTEAQLTVWIEKIKAAGILSIDTETTSITAAEAELVGISLSTAAGNGAYIPLAHKANSSDGFDFGDAPQDVPAQLDKQLVLDALKPILADESIIKIAQNLKYDWQVLANAYGLTPNTQAYHTFIQNYEDTMLLSFALNGGKHGHGMDDLSKKYLGITPIPFKEVCGTGKSQITFDYVEIDKATQYAAEDTDITLRLYELFNAQITQAERTDVQKLYTEVERPLIPILAAMEHTGVAINKAELARLSLNFQTEITALEAEIHALAGEPFNIASPKQLGEILFDKMGLPPVSKKRSTNVDVLEKLADQGHVIATKVLAFRSASKLKSTYSDALAEKINPTSGRIHTHYHQAGAGTGRFSSSDPNLQNIPTRTPAGKAIRTAFIASEGMWLASLDYSQIELRLLAHFSQSAPLMDAFKADKDIHARTAELIFADGTDKSGTDRSGTDKSGTDRSGTDKSGTDRSGTDKSGTELDTSEQRRVAKMINFGIVYGMGPVNLAKQTGFSRAEATAFIERYFERYTGVRQYMSHNKEFALTNGYVSTLLGRRVHLPDINSPNGMLKAGAERAAINAPLQGSNADVIKKAMIDIQDYLITNNKQTRMLMQVHDELIFEGPDSEKDILPDLKRLMENAVTLDVPLKVEGGMGSNWGDLK